VKRPLYELGSVVGSAVTALTSAAASVCCIGPLAVTLLGVNGVILAAAFQPYRWSILAGSLLLLTLAFWGAYRGWRVRPGAACDARAGRATRLLLWVSLAVWLAAVAVNLFVTEFWLKRGGTL
jgi:hypothetical protein